MSRMPIVVILGATSTGKSKLAVQLAKRFNGEIISADSVQVYRGLDISSNKITVEERCGIPHHMLDILKPSDRFTVLDYRNQTLPIIEDISHRNKLPIIVGGSNYYIESVLWKVLVDSDDQRKRSSFMVYDENRESHLGLIKTYDDDSTVTSARTDDDEDSRKIDLDYDAQDVGSKIRIVLSKFESTLKNIVRGVKIPLSFYKNTFYPNSSSDYSSNVHSKTAVDLSEIELLLNVPQVELKLISGHLRMCLNRHFDTNVNGFEPLSSENSQTVVATADDTYNQRVLKLLLTDPTYSFDPNFWELISRLEEQRSLNSRMYDVVSFNLLQGLSYLANTRSRRVALLRVVDDALMDDFNSGQLYQQLKLVDPVIASTVHPNNRRKVIRSLQVYMMTGKRHSDIIKEQRESDGGSLLGGPLRYPDPCVIWLQCDQDVLNDRIEKRLHEMVGRGLIEELEQFYDAYQEEIKNCHRNYEYDLGIFQSIGLKEFCPYLEFSPEKRASEEGRKLLQDSIDVMSLVTKRYSRYQIRWIQKRFIEVPNREVPPIYNLDSSSVENWQTDVEDPAYDILNGYLSGRLVRDPIPSESPDPDRFVGGEYFCDVCHRVFVGLYQWKIHLDSKRHQKALYKKKQRDAVSEENRHFMENS